MLTKLEDRKQNKKGRQGLRALLVVALMCTMAAAAGSGKDAAVDASDTPITVNSRQIAPVTRRAMAAVTRIGSSSFLPQNWLDMTTAPEPRPIQINWKKA